MADLDISRCAVPTMRGRSTYTVVGFAGYGVANLLAAALFVAWLGAGGAAQTALPRSSWRVQP